MALDDKDWRDIRASWARDAWRRDMAEKLRQLSRNPSLSAHAQFICRMLSGDLGEEAQEVAAGIVKADDLRRMSLH